MYAPQAHTRDEVIAAMKKKQENLLKEAQSYAKGLIKIEGLQSKTFYELSYKDAVWLVQVWDFGRDHVGFRVYACNKGYKELNMSFPNDRISLGWNYSFEVSPPQSPSLYMDFIWKTSHFNKLLKGKTCFTIPTVQS